MSYRGDKKSIKLERNGKIKTRAVSKHDVTTTVITQELPPNYSPFENERRGLEKKTITLSKASKKNHKEKM